jgi:hypothetical protein
MIVLSVVQALCGAVSANTKAITLEFTGDDVVAHFLLRQESPVDREEIEDDFPTEVAALTMGLPEVGDVLVIPKIELVESHPAGYRPPGRLVILLRD